MACNGTSSDTWLTEAAWSFPDDGHGELWDGRFGPRIESVGGNECACYEVASCDCASPLNQADATPLFGGSESIFALDLNVANERVERNRPEIGMILRRSDLQKICCKTCEFDWDQRQYRVVTICGYTTDGGITISEDPEDAWVTRRYCNVPCPPEEEANRCGPDVSTAFLEDISDHARQVQEHVGSGLPEGLPGEFFRNVASGGVGLVHSESIKHRLKYGLSYKWMDFSDPRTLRGPGDPSTRYPGGREGCGTGKCSGTVGFLGACIPQNELGNIGATFLLAAFARGDTLALAFRRGLGKVYEAAPGRRDNVVAFLLGVELYQQVNAGSLSPSFLGRIADHGMREIYEGHRDTTALLRLMAREDIAGWPIGKGGYTFDDMVTTSKGVNTNKECQPCDKPRVDKMSGWEHSGNLFSEWWRQTGPKIDPRSEANVEAYDRWLETQVPPAIRR